MTIIKHELKQNRTSFLIWTSAIGLLLMICVLVFPDMKNEMNEVSDMFSSMGSFSAAFGMDRINFGEFMGFYSVECGNVLGLGGAMFAALIGITMLAKEERDHTAEFLLTHPVSRARVVTEKLIAVVIEVVLMNVIIFLLIVLSLSIIGESPEWKQLILVHLAYFLLQIEIACVCFGISAFLNRGSLGIGLGMTMILYFLNLIANITDSAEILKYITPFAYTEGADIIINGALNGPLVSLGIAYTVVGIIVGFVKYCRKDIR